MSSIDLDVYYFFAEVSITIKCSYICARGLCVCDAVRVGNCCLKSVHVTSLWYSGTGWQLRG